MQTPIQLISKGHPMTDELEKLKNKQVEIQHQIDLATAKLLGQNIQNTSQSHAKQETYKGRVIEFKDYQFKVNSVIQGFDTLEQAKEYIDGLHNSVLPKQKTNQLSANEKKWIGILLLALIFGGLFVFDRKLSIENNSLNSAPTLQGKESVKNNFNFIKGTIYQIPFSRSTGKCMSDGSVCIDDIKYENLCKRAEGFTTWGYERSADAYFGMGDYLAKNGNLTNSSIKWQKFANELPECIARLTIEGIYKGTSRRWKSYAVVTQFLYSEEGKVLVHSADFKYEER